MKFNGSVAVKGSGPHMVDLIAAATAPGEAGLEKKGVLRLANGVKFQWDSVSVAATTSGVVTLPEAYTEAHYTAACSMNEDIGYANTTLACNCWIPASSSLSTLVVRNIDSSSHTFTYISIGKDTI